MSSLEKAVATQLQNIQTKSGKTLAELSTLVQASGLTRHSEIRDMLMRDVGLSYGDANALVHFVLKSDGERAAESKGLTGEQVLAEIYAGPKADLRPIHVQLMSAIDDFGAFEIAPKKGYVSLRRKKQFAMIGPATNTRVEVGLNMKNVDTTTRLVALPAGGMCNYRVRIAHVEEIDDELIGWIKQAYDSAG